MFPCGAEKVETMILTMMALACVSGDDSDNSSKPLVWWEDPCGRRDPLDHECPTGVKTVEVGTDPTCADEGIKPGDSCDDAGATCTQLRPIACEDDPKKIIASDAVLTCGTEPPDDNCPISSRTAKTDITYVDDAARRQLAKQALDLHLATYEYKDPAKNGVGPQLGYILEDAPDAVFSGKDHVNLYAYTSAVLAAVQEQQAEIHRLQAKVDELQKTCAR
jgi:hypothetical protein